MNCEVCGKPIKHFHEVMIQDSILRVCDDCAKYGKEIRKKSKVIVEPSSHPMNVQSKPQPREPTPVMASHPTPRKKSSPSEDEDIELIENFGEIIRKKREEMNLSQEDFAKKLQEKKNLIAKIEREEIKPDIYTARKIEKMLGIRLLEKF